MFFTIPQEVVMALKTLFLGILFSLGIFAVKSGFGLKYYMGTCDTTIKKISGYLCFILAYGLIFFLAARLAGTMAIMTWFPLFQLMIKYAMGIHFIMALMMLIWGILLLKQKSDMNTKSRGWVLLALPCPVCAVVIFLCVAFLMAYAPQDSYLAVALVFIGFLALNLVTLVLAFLLEKETATSSEKIMGSAMLFIAVYFLLSVLIMPQFANLGEVYRLACHTVEGSHRLSMEQQLTFFILTLLFVIGFAMSMRKRLPSK